MNNVLVVGLVSIVAYFAVLALWLYMDKRREAEVVDDPTPEVRGTDGRAS